MRKIAVISVEVSTCLHGTKSKNLVGIADFELRNFGSEYNKLDHPQITQIFSKQSA